MTNQACPDCGGSGYLDDYAGPNTAEPCGCGDPMTFEGWKYQWCHELALMIDNDRELLSITRELVSEILERDHADRMLMARELREKTRYGFELGQYPVPLGGISMDGWLELLEHYEAQVLEERSYE